MANQLKFESIAIRPIEYTTETKIEPKKHKNNKTGNEPRNIGRDGQINDTPYPTCPYHMPINSSRYLDPRLYMPTKLAGDIIRAKDLNDLIDRMKVLIKLWNAEQDDLKGYGIHSKIRARITHLYPNHIVRSVPVLSSGVESSETYNILEGSNAIINNTLNTTYTNTVTNPTVSGTVEFTTSFKNGCKIEANGNKLDFYGFYKAGYFDDPTGVYIGSLTFTDTTITGEAILNGSFDMDTDGYSIQSELNYDHLLIQPEGQRLDIYTRLNGFIDPISVGDLIFSGVSFSGPDIDVDCKRFKIVANNKEMKIYKVTATGSITTTTTVGGVTTTTTTPVVDDSKDLVAPYRDETLVATYTLSGVTTTSATTTLIPGLASHIEEPKEYGFYMIMDSNEATVRASVGSAINNPDGIVGQIHKHYKLGDVLPFRIPKLLIHNYDTTAHNHHGGVTDLLPIQAVEGMSSSTFNLRIPTLDDFVTDAANVKVEYAYNTGYVWSYRTPEPEGFLRYIGIAAIEIPRPYWNVDGNKNVINEYDWTYTVNHNKNYKARYPIIKQVEWNKIRNTLRTYCDKVINLDMLTGDVDNTGVNDFLAAQVGSGSSTVDLNDPDTAFDNYQANEKAIIKVNFYNVLVEAYRVLVNSCLCNSDCSCNSNCLCNTNCGCNYSG